MESNSNSVTYSEDVLGASQGEDFAAQGEGDDRQRGDLGAVNHVLQYKHSHRHDIYLYNTHSSDH